MESGPDDAAQMARKLADRGRDRLEAGDYVRAEQYLSAAAAQGADPHVIVPLIIAACIASARYRAALSKAKPHLARNPKDVQLRIIVAAVHVGLGQTEAAHVELQRAVRQAPEHAGARYLLALLLRDHLRQIDAARAQFAAYLRIAPDGPHAEEARAWADRQL